MSGTSGLSFILGILLSMFIPFLSHLVLLRIFDFGRETAMRQKGAILNSLVGLVPLTGIWIAWCCFFLGPGQTFSTLDVLYIILIYTLFSYVYFHIFNMSETARRIHILSGQPDQLPVSKESIFDNYTSRHLLEVRLRRLLALNELREVEGKYIVGRGVLVLPARIVFWFRGVLFPPVPEKNGLPVLNGKKGPSGRI